MTGGDGGNDGGNGKWRHNRNPMNLASAYPKGRRDPLAGRGAWFRMANLAATLWIPAFAGMTGATAGMTRETARMTGEAAGMTGEDDGNDGVEIGNDGGKKAGITAQ